VFAGILGTMLVHLTLLALLVTEVKPIVAGPPVYAVELVAAPEPEPAAKPAPAVVERPPQPAPVKPAPAPPKPKPTPKTPPPPTPSATKREPTPRTTAPVAPAPGETPSTGADPLTVKTPGLEFPYPEYLRNIVSQVDRRWSRPLGSGGMRAEVSFLILRNGSVKDIQFTARSGNFSFDLGAQGAIEAAGNAAAFGPLPDGYPADVLPVTFFFTPRTGQ
jgi:protein TonB